jgi:RNA recognition motif-containing protein
MNIFVAKLGRRTTADDLIHLFSAYGEVLSAKIIIDRMTNVSKGYGFVEMANDAEGEVAISRLNDSTFQDSVIVVKQAHPREERPVRQSVIKKNSPSHFSTTIPEEEEEPGEPLPAPETE